MHTNELPTIYRIKEIRRETPSVKTFFLDSGVECRPGQFFMFWLPGKGEKPFVLSYTGNKTGFSVKKVGKFTEKIFSLKKGDKIGLRGPYGNGFELRKNCLVVAGGIGAAAVANLTETLSFPTLILGAKTKSELLFLKRFKNAKKIITTDDGSAGKKCDTCTVLEQELKREKYSMVCACGPEPMLKRVFEVCELHGVECQLSLERHMKCGFGVCGQCFIDEFSVCRDGPVFRSKQLRKMKEFGKTAYLKSGKKVSVQDYSKWREE